MKGVGVGPDHHDHFLQGVGPTPELRPVHSVLVATAVVPTAVPHAVEVGVGAGVVPPTAFLVMGTVTWEGNKKL